MRTTMGLMALAWMAGCGRGGDLPGTSPSVEVLTPLAGQAFAKQSEVVVRVRVADAEDQDLSRITLTWGGIAAGVPAPAHPNADGIAELHMNILEVGNYLATLSVQDGDQRVTAAEVSVQVVDGDQDQDGDISSVLGGTDCDDSSAAVHPGATEVCNGIDDDCSGTADQEAVDAVTFYRDQDEDGDGVLLGTVEACEAPAGYAATATDCDDNRSDVYAGADELCDGVDNDCEGDTDESDAIDGYAWYADADSDGFGDPAALMFDCEQPEGFVDDNTDCDDTSEGTYLGAPELCDDADNDCDGGIDEAAVDRTNWYADVDEDGAGAGAATLACDAPVGFVALSGDCDDSESEVGPLADEFCNDRDDNCNGSVDEDTVDTKVWYTDADGDGYGDAAAPVDVCLSGPGLVSNADDCNDGDADQNPETVWRIDADGDGFGDDDTGTVQCESPGWSWVLQGGDCADYDWQVSPGAEEVCVTGIVAQGQDDNCDGVVDDGCPEIHCGTISEDEVWGGGPNGHVITCPVYVEGPDAPVLTIEDGAQVWVFGNGLHALTVGQTEPGSLQIEGTTDGVVMREYPGRQDNYLGWISLEAAAEPSVIEGLDMEGAHNPLTAVADVDLLHSRLVSSLGWWVVRVEGATANFDDVDLSGSNFSGLIAVDTPMTLQNSKLHHNTEYGAVIYPESWDLSDAQDLFTNNEISDNQLPLYFRYAELTKALAANNSIHDNDIQRIYAGYGWITSDAIWHDFGMPYLFSSIHVRNGAVWTLDDGVELQTYNGNGIAIGCPPASWGWVCDENETGDIVVNGDVKGVTLTSSLENPQPGDTEGFHAMHMTSATHVKGLAVEYSNINRWYSDEGLTFEDLTIAHSVDGLLITPRLPGGQPNNVVDGCLLEDIDNFGIATSGATVSVNACTIRDTGPIGYLGSAGVLTFTDNEVSGTTGDYAAYHWGPVNDFSGNTITGNDGMPFLVSDATELRGVSEDNVLAGNGDNYLMVWNPTADRSVEFPVLDVPIYLKNGLSINPGRSQNPVISILDNDVLLGQNALLTVGNGAPGGRLEIAGSRLQGLEATAGYWGGIGYFTQNGGSITDSEIRDSGSWIAAIWLGNTDSAVIEHNVIANSGGAAISCYVGCTSIIPSLSTNQFIGNLGPDWNP